MVPRLTPASALRDCSWWGLGEPCMGGAERQTWVPALCWTRALTAVRCVINGKMDRVLIPTSLQIVSEVLEAYIINVAKAILRFIVKICYLCWLRSFRVFVSSQAWYWSLYPLRVCWEGVWGTLSRYLCLVGKGRLICPICWYKHLYRMFLWC